MKKNALTLLFFTLSSVAFCQLRTGVVLDLSEGWIRKSDYPSNYGQSDYVPGQSPIVSIYNREWKARPCFGIGYQLQYEKNKYMYDFALMYQNQGVHASFVEGTKDIDQTKRLNAISGKIVINHFIWNRLYAGIGVEPTFYWDNAIWGNTKKQRWDFPAIAQIGYDFKFIQVNGFFKYGFLPVFEQVGITQKAYTQNAGISIFIPIKF